MILDSLAPTSRRPFPGRLGGGVSCGFIGKRDTTCRLHQPGALAWGVGSFMLLCIHFSESAWAWLGPWAERQPVLSTSAWKTNEAGQLGVLPAAGLAASRPQTFHPHRCQPFHTPGYLLEQFRLSVWFKGTTAVPVLKLERQAEESRVRLTQPVQRGAAVEWILKST